MVPALLESQVEYGLDAASITFDVYNIEAEGLGQKLVWSDEFMPDVEPGGDTHSEPGRPVENPDARFRYGGKLRPGHADA